MGILGKRENAFYLVGRNVIVKKRLPRDDDESPVGISSRLLFLLRPIRLNHGVQFDLQRFKIFDPDVGDVGFSLPQDTVPSEKNVSSGTEDHFVVSADQRGFALLVS